MGVRVKSGSALRVCSHHARVRHLVLGNDSISSDQVQQIGKMGKGCCVTLDSGWFPALALCDISTVTFSDSTTPTQTAVPIHEQRVLAGLLETSPRGVFPPGKGPSRGSLPLPKGWDLYEEKDAPKLGKRKVPFYIFFLCFPPTLCI